MLEFKKDQTLDIYDGLEFSMFQEIACLCHNINKRGSLKCMDVHQIYELIIALKDIMIVLNLWHSKEYSPAEIEQIKDKIRPRFTAPGENENDEKANH